MKFEPQLNAGLVATKLCNYQPMDLIYPTLTYQGACHNENGNLDSVALVRAP